MNLPTRKTRRSELRLYHFGATLLVVGLVLWVLYGVLAVKKTTDENLEQTHCNQGLLFLATQHVRDETRLSFCPKDIRVKLQGVK